MSQLCACDIGLSSLGLPNCPPELGTPKRFLYQFETADDGTKNCLDPATLTDKAAWDLAFNNPDKSKRLYATPNFDSYNPERAAAETETTDSGTSYKLRDGIKTVTASFGNDNNGVAIGLTKLMKQLECAPIVIYVQTDCSSVFGKEVRSECKIYGIKIVNKDVSLVEPSFGTKGKTQFSFEYDRSIGDVDMGYISGESIGFDLCDIALNVQADAKLLAQTANSACVTFRSFFGGVTDYVVLRGIVATDVEILRADGVTIVPVVSLIETSTNGKYDLVYDNTGIPSGEELTVNVTRSGADFNTFTITQP